MGEQGAGVGALPEKGAESCPKSVTPSQGQRMLALGDDLQAITGLRWCSPNQMGEHH